MATAAKPRVGRKATPAAAPQGADVLVVFGITGDLAKVMTFRSLYDLERDGDGIARVTLQDPDGRGLSLWVDDAYPYLMLFTGDPLPDVARRGLAVEPMTCPPNAFRTGRDLIRLGGGSRSPAGGVSTRPDRGAHLFGRPACQA